MQLSLKKAVLIKRYKRFLADVILADGSETTIHVANTGAMTGCADEGDIVWYSTSDNPKRKYPYSWELTEKSNGDIICVNTLRANQLVEEALIDKRISDVYINAQNKAQNPDKYDVKREVKYGEENSKIDFLLQPKTTHSLNNASNIVDVNNIFIEVKSVTLLDKKQGYFPDSVTTRGQKHLRELMQITQEKQNAVLLFAVLHSGIHSVKPALHIDKIYAELLQKSHKTGVTIIAYKAEFSFQSNEKNTSVIIKLTHQLPIID